ncbi:mitochondrial carrier domain-containing protein [Zychaea mexicana]|uniref:mitochondrial carrier domain-containing protein n=1 Tax=Zychaea mexicana TaxID=64656 RepID=UPI0022FDD93C|nr:mitochondrial carrier domain-containing protein [Zychaea mexicana]KAI9495939.1 mitochondrial carrier domain-containing protein [Zychaea mexicana]
MTPSIVNRTQKNYSVAELYKYHFAAGAMGLSLSYACMHPLDTIKTRIQADNTHSWRRIFTRETARSLGKGFFVSALGAAGQGGARFSTYEFCKSQLIPDDKKWAIPVTALSAVIGDLASSVIKVPREVVTAKLQTDHYAGRSTASFVVRQTLAEEGPRGLFKGFWAIAARDSPFMVILLVSYENFKAFHRRSVHQEWINRVKQQKIVASAAFEETGIPTLQTIVYGGVSGFLAGYLTTPMDVIRTRIITERRHQQPVTATDMTRRMLYQASGKPSRMYREFFAGAMPRSCWWFGICAIFFPTYETLKTVMLD